jgi:hypothetical protein
MPYDVSGNFDIVPSVQYSHGVNPRPRAYVPDLPPEAAECLDIALVCLFGGYGGRGLTWAVLGGFMFYVMMDGAGDGELWLPLWANILLGVTGGVSIAIGLTFLGIRCFGCGDDDCLQTWWNNMLERRRDERTTRRESRATERSAAARPGLFSVVANPPATIAGRLERGESDSELQVVAEARPR